MIKKKNFEKFGQFSANLKGILAQKTQKVTIRQNIFSVEVKKNWNKKNSYWFNNLEISYFS